MLGLLNWGRTYNSLSAAPGGLGTGWTISFSASLQPSGPQGLLHHTAAHVSFHDEDGRVLVFTQAADEVSPARRTWTRPWPARATAASRQGIRRY
jgi:Domain of unknown function (DUF6531)